MEGGRRQSLGDRKEERRGGIGGERRGGDQREWRRGEGSGEKSSTEGLLLIMSSPGLGHAFSSFPGMGPFKSISKPGSKPRRPTVSQK